MNEQKKLYKLIENYSFVIYETALYLDGHPNCRRALAHYAKYRAKLLEAAHLYEEKYGPLTMYGQNGCDVWQWVKAPWPWEYREDEGDCR